MVKFEKPRQSDYEYWMDAAINNAVHIYNELLTKPGEWALFGSRNLKEKTDDGKLACEIFNALSNIFFYTFQSHIKFPRTETMYKDVDGTRFYYAKVNKTLWQKIFKKKTHS